MNTHTFLNAFLNTFFGELTLYHQVALVSLFAFLILGAFDGIYFHLIKYKLYLHPQSKFEHQIHSVRGVLLAIIIASTANAVTLSELIDSKIIAILIIVGLIGFDLVLEIIDIYVEKESRDGIGGVSPSETVLHVFASSFRLLGVSMLLIGAFQDPLPAGFVTCANLASATALLVGVGSLFLTKVERPVHN